MFNVYIYQNQINYKYYVGQTINFSNRKSRHKTASGGNPYFHNAIKKYGWENFKLISLMEVNSKEEMNELEMLMIEDLDSMNPEKGYNLTKGGEGPNGKVLSEETKQKISNSISGINHWNFGGTISDSHKKAISEAHKNIPRSQETKNKISEKNKGKTGVKGHLVSSETREKIKIGNIGKKRTQETCDNIGKSKKGKKRTQKSIEKQIESRKGYRHSKETIEKIRLSNINKIRSKETREKISNARKGKKLSLESIEKREQTKRKNRELKKNERRKIK